MARLSAGASFRKKKYDAAQSNAMRPGSVALAVRSLVARPGPRLQDADLVAERVAQAAVDPVAVIGRLLRELDALGAEPLVRGEAVVGAEHHDDPGGALRDEISNLLGGLLVHHRRARDVEHDLGERLAGDADGQPAEAATGVIGLDLQFELPDVEVERLLVIEDPDVG